MRVLFVDDDQVVAQSVEMALRQKGHACELADLGERALSLAKNNEYDIIVLDVALPDVDGDQVARRMKLEGIKTPLLLQSGLDDPTLAAEAKDAGAHDFLAKPFSIADLIDRMEVVLGLPRSGAAPEPQARRSASRDEGQPETKAPCEQPPAGAVLPQGSSQDDPPHRPSAVAEARAALRAQPEPPTRLQAASGVMAEGGAKALSKARAALAAQRAGRTKPPSSPEAMAAEGADDAAESTTEIAVAGGVKAFAEPLARVRTAFGDKPISKATDKARAALRDKFQSRPKAADDSDVAPGDADTEADTDAESGSDAQAGLGLAARARAALDANPLTQAMAKTRTALREKRGSRAAADPEAEPIPEAELPPQLKPEFWAEPETRIAPGPASEPEPVTEVVPQAGPKTGDEPNAHGEPETEDQPESVTEPELEAGRQPPVDHEPCGPTSNAGHSSHPEAENALGEADEPLAADPDADRPASDPAPGPEPQASPASAASLEVQEQDGPASEAESRTQREPEIEDSPPERAEAQESSGPEPDVGAPAGAAIPLSEPRPEAASTEESGSETAEQNEQEASAALAQNALDNPAVEPEMTALADHQPGEAAAELEPPMQQETGIEDPIRDSAEAEGPLGSEPETVVPSSAVASDPEPQPQPEALDTAESRTETAEHDGPESTAEAEPIADREPQPEAGPAPEVAMENPLGGPAEAEKSPSSETDAAAPDSVAPNDVTVADPEPQSPPAPASPPDPESGAASSPEVQEPDGPAPGSGTEPDKEIEGPLQEQAEVQGSSGPDPELGASAVAAMSLSEPWPVAVSAEEPSPETTEQDEQDASPEVAPNGADLPSNEPSLEAEPAPAEETPAEEITATGEAADQAESSNRRHDRKETIEAAVIDDGSNQIPCVIVDLSESGARLLLLDTAQQCPWRFLLVPVEGPEHRCVRRWRDGEKIGVEFEEPDAEDDQETPTEAEGEEVAGEESQ